MSKITTTPFNEYREEQSGIKLTEYFVRPDYFSQLGDNKPKMIYGSRGTGKTTLLKALTIEQADDVQLYLDENDYIGFYYRTNLNIASAFWGSDMSEDFWFKLFSYYFVCSMSHIVVKQINLIKKYIGADEKAICQEISRYLDIHNIKSFLQLISGIKEKEREIEIYLNNMPYVDPPLIGAYANLLKDIPQIIFDNSNSAGIGSKHFIYLIDEFESLQKYQQKAILSLVKYANKQHTYIIGLRPLGLKISSTVGEEYIRETDDYSTYVLDEANANYKDFALKVCNKRLELFYNKYFPDVRTIPTIDIFFDAEDRVDEIERLFENKKKFREHKARVKCFLEAFEIYDDDTEKYLTDNPEQFYLVVLKLTKKRKGLDKVERATVMDEIHKFQNMDEEHTEFVHNYKMAIIFYLCKLYSCDKLYYGFNTIVNLSGNTLRYLLEMCNEIFLREYREDEGFYESPHFIDVDLQTEEIIGVSKRRLEQIKAVPDDGPKMRQFMNAFGAIASIHHEDSRLSKWEPNHFSIKSSNKSNEEITRFLKECVFRGILVQLEDNKIKVKNTISYDQYIYKMHSIYTPGFQISFRKKQKFDFYPDEIATMIGDDTERINKLIDKYNKKVLSSKIEEIVAFLRGNKGLGVDDGQRSIFDDYM